MTLIERLKKRILLSENAKLFDTKEYLFKAFVAVLMAAALGQKSSYISKDMISLLFGMMLTLEPVNMSGIRSGLSQIEATLIGAFVTGVIVAIFGYGILATAFGITLTLYVCMVINWRELKVVAVFTAIYMTQYVQLNAVGELSEIETLKLRLVALGSGVLIAFIVNFVFSLFGYKRMVNKRIYYISKELYELGFGLKVGLAHKDLVAISEVMNKLPPLFNTIDWITATLKDVQKDQKRFKIVYRHLDTVKFIEYCNALREITHELFDFGYRIKDNEFIYMSDSFLVSFEERLGHFEAVKEAFNSNIELPTASWKETHETWLDQFSIALEKLNH